MSDDDSSVQPRIKTQTFTLKERKLVLRLVNKHYDVVHNKKVDSRSTNQKNQAWEAIHQEFVAQTSIVKLPRTPQQLKRCWENLRSKAKKGDLISQKLLQWGESRYTMNQSNGGDFQDNNGVEEAGDPLLDEDSVSSIDEREGDESKDLSDPTYANIEENLQKLSNLVNTGACQQCQHCQCDKMEKMVRVDFLKLEKRQKDLIHRLKLQNLKAKLKREKETHRLIVHELSLKVENERRRAEILDKELRHYS